MAKSALSDVDMDVASLAAAVAEAGPGEDRLATIRALAARARVLRAEVASLDEALKSRRADLARLTSEILPAKMDEYSVPAIELGPEGNYPAVRVEVRPFARANIAAGWPPEKRAAAHAYLDSVGAGGLIKTEVTISFDRDARTSAIKFAETVQAQGLTVEVYESVMWSMLTAWLKEELQAGRMPKLDLIGGHVGRYADVTDVKV